MTPHYPSLLLELRIGYILFVSASVTYNDFQDIASCKLGKLKTSPEVAKVWLEIHCAIAYMMGENQTWRFRELTFIKFLNSLTYSFTLQLVR